MKYTPLLAIATAILLSATPAVAQEEEEPRTTYAVTAIDLADGADDRWFEIQTDYIQPARVAAGMSEATIHWVMLADDYDIVVVAEMPGGMANLDSHAPASRVAYMEALTELVGGEAALEALGEERDTLVEKSMTLYTHTHP